MLKKFKINRILSLTLCLLIVISSSIISFADDYETTIEGDLFQETSRPDIAGELAKAGDTAIYHVQIDHSLYPEALLYACSYGSIGDFQVSVSDGSRDIGGTTIRNTALDSTIITLPKGLIPINNSNGDIKNYRIVVTASTDNVGYAVNLGTWDTISKNFNRLSSAASVPKNIPTEKEAELINDSGFCQSYVALLDDGDWYNYTADGYTYITATMLNNEKLAFEVYDADTSGLVYRTTPNDTVIQELMSTSTMYTGAVQKGLNLVNGKNYLIRFYSTSVINCNNIKDKYNVYIGLPSTVSDKKTVKSSSSYSLPANTTKTYTINVSGFEKSARAGRRTTVSFGTSNTIDNYSITSCTFTDPNGNKFTADYGKYSDFNNPDIVNFLTSRNNTPLNGRWTVTVKSSKALSNMKFQIDGYYLHVLGNDGN